MDKDLINAYAHSNLHEALLAVLYADIIAHDKNPHDAFHAFRNDVAHHLKMAVFPAEDENAEEIRRLGLDSLVGFFKAVAENLVVRKVLKPDEIVPLLR